MAAHALHTVRRSLLYVPASSSRFLDKSRTLPHIDNITYDLEDSVTPDRKPEARQALRAFLEKGKPQNVREVAVRVNSVESGFALRDLEAILPAPNIDALVIPKVNTPADLHFITNAARHLLSQHAERPKLKLLALVESALALTSLPAICTASPLLDGLIFAAEDFALDLSLTRTPSLSEFSYARSAIVTAARANNLPSAIDLVCTAFRGDAGAQTLREECEGGKRLGFNGKQLIHPSQAAVADEVFGVSEQEAEWAVRVCIAEEKAREQGRGAWSLDGKMIDRPVVGKAEGLLERARVCGVDVGELRERWRGQEPE